MYNIYYKKCVVDVESWLSNILSPMLVNKTTKRYKNKNKLSHINSLYWFTKHSLNLIFNIKYNIFLNIEVQWNKPLSIYFCWVFSGDVNDMIQILFSLKI